MLTICILHNYIMKNRGCKVLNSISLQGDCGTTTAFSVRDTLSKFFSSPEGKLLWEK